MADPLQYLWPAPGNYGAPFGRVAPATLTPIQTSLCEVGAFSGKDLAVRRVISRTFGETPRKPYGSFTTAGKMRIVTCAPGRWLIIGATLTQIRKLEKSVPKDAGTVVNLDNARSFIRVSGSGARALLARGIEIDLRDKPFPVGASAECAMQHFSCLLLHEDVEDYLIGIYASFAQSAWEWMLEAGAELGIRVKRDSRSL